jgi:branched-subunit amino acid ABC-type transport system permease component
MTGGYLLLAQARDNADRVLNENLVTAASIALIAASILWVIVSRLVVRNLRKGANLPLTGSLKARDIWKEPPTDGDT